MLSILFICSHQMLAAYEEVLGSLHLSLAFSTYGFWLEQVNLHLHNLRF